MIDLLDLYEILSNENFSKWICADNYIYLMAYKYELSLYVIISDVVGSHMVLRNKNDEILHFNYDLYKNISGLKYYGSIEDARVEMDIISLMTDERIVLTDDVLDEYYTPRVVLEIRSDYIYTTSNRATVTGKITKIDRKLKIMKLKL